jgi:hypothetical protein
MKSPDEQRVLVLSSATGAILDESTGAGALGLGFDADPSWSRWMAGVHVGAVLAPVWCDGNLVAVAVGEPDRPGSANSSGVVTLQPLR